MVQVPDIVPTAAPSTGGVAGPSPSIPADAFGGLVGQAIQHMGGSLEQDSNAIFQRAVQIQEMNNATEANKADADFMEQAGAVHYKFNALEGAEKARAFPQYISDLKGLREQVGGRVSNPAARRMYDAQTLSTLSRTIFSGAAIAGDAAGRASVDAWQQKANAHISRAAESGDPTIQAVEIERAKDAQVGALRQQGLDTPDAVFNATQSVNDKAFYNILSKVTDGDIKGKDGQTGPWSAEKQLDELEQSQSISPGMAKKLREEIDNKKIVIGAPNIGRDTMKEIIDKDTGQPTKSLGDAQKIAEDKAYAIEPNKQLAGKLAETAKNEVSKQYHSINAANVNFMRENENTLYTTFQNNPNVRNSQELLAASPEASRAANNLPDRDKIRWFGPHGVVDRLIDSRDRKANTDSLKYISSIRNNDHEAFLNLDPTDPKWKLDYKGIGQVNEWKHSDTSKAFNDVRVDHAMTWARQNMPQQLDDLKLRSYHAPGTPEDNSTNYNTFTTALSTSLDRFFDKNKREPDGEEYRKMIIPLIQNHAVPRKFLGISLPDKDVPVYQSFSTDYTTQDYKDFARATSAEIAKKGGEPPTEGELQHSYRLQQINNLYPKSSPAKAPGQ